MKDRKLFSVLSCSYGNWLLPAWTVRTVFPSVLSALCSVPGAGAESAVPGPGAWDRSQALVLDMAVPMTTVHSYTQLHPLFIHVRKCFLSSSHLCNMHYSISKYRD